MKVKEKFNRILDYKTIFKDASKLYRGLCTCYVILFIIMIVDISLYEDNKKWKSIIMILVYLFVFMLYGMLSRIMGEA